MQNLLPKTIPLTPTHLIESFLSGRNKKTIQAYRQDLEDFKTFLNAATLDEAAKIILSSSHGQANALALSYKAYLIDRGLQAATINRKLAALRSLVKLARTLGIVPWSLEVENMKTKAYRDTRGCGKSGFRSLLDQVETSKKAKSIRDHAILRLLYDLGLRRGEIVTLKLEDVDLSTGTIAVIGKGYTEKTILTLPDPTKEALHKWINIRGLEAGSLFINFDRAGKGSRLTGVSIYRIVRKLGEKIGIKTRPHGLRHTAITEAVKKAQANGIGLDEVRDFSRHADIKTLLIYRDRERNVQGILSALVAAEI